MASWALMVSLSNRMGCYSQNEYHDWLMGKGRMECKNRIAGSWGRMVYHEGTKNAKKISTDKGLKVYARLSLNHRLAECERARPAGIGFRSHLSSCSSCL